MRLTLALLACPLWAAAAYLKHPRQAALQPFTDTSSDESLCGSFAQLVDLTPHNASFLNATFWPSASYVLNDVTNTLDFCEVHINIQYASNNTLLFALWLPLASTYQSRFMAVGNGAYAGIIDTGNMLLQMNNGYGMAIAGSDAGHTAKANNGGIGIPGLSLPFLQDDSSASAWIHGSVAMFTPVALLLVENYYSSAPNYSYFDGCSTGGAQGYALAQRHPDLFDGIYAGSPGNWYSHLILSFLWNSQHTNTSLTSLSSSNLNTIHQAVLNACDRIDGVSDNVIENPLMCNFAIDSLQCSWPWNLFNCLLPSQVSAVKAIYSGAVRSDNGAMVYPGFSFGSEAGWFLQTGILSTLSSIPILQNLVFNNLKWKSQNFNWASDVTLVKDTAGAVLDSISSDLSTFHNRGGKLVSTQGWADPINAATWPITHLSQLQTTMGNSTVEDFYRLFMVPGGGHCGGEATQPMVPGLYHRVPLLVDWVENGIAPTQMLSSDPPVGNGTRKLCPWPQQAVYVGFGDIHSYDSYSCKQVMPSPP